jgi:hypothetical protein
MRTRVPAGIVTSRNSGFGGASGLASTTTGAGADADADAEVDAETALVRSALTSPEQPAERNTNAPTARSPDRKMDLMMPSPLSSASDDRPSIRKTPGNRRENP